MKIKKSDFEKIKELVNFDNIESSDDMQRNLEYIAEILENISNYNGNRWFCIDKVTGERI